MNGTNELAYYESSLLVREDNLMSDKGILGGCRLDMHNQRKYKNEQVASTSEANSSHLATNSPLLTADLLHRIRKNITPRVTYKA